MQRLRTWDQIERDRTPLTTGELIAVTGVGVHIVKQRINTGQIKSRKVKDASRFGHHREIPFEEAVRLRSDNSFKVRRYQSKPAKQKSLGLMETKPAELEQPDYSFQNHASFAYGHCLSFLQNYALETGVPIKKLLGTVGGLMERGAR
jgi:hypothetical protein